jgi:hypothetical protein
MKMTRVTDEYTYLEVYLKDFVRICFHYELLEVFSCPPSMKFLRFSSSMMCKETAIHKFLMAQLSLANKLPNAFACIMPMAPGRDCISPHN